ncbi:Transcription factor [Quillaja saponaria]|uniref:Transcription factor n=1 Tax=Quillaja saponaria TaxID=32244 RepID=A0AAD7KPW4_QUISA|nr:Transcription factor [Quillaja saponaria]
MVDVFDLGEERKLNNQEMALEAITFNELFNFIIYDTISATPSSSCSHDSSETGLLLESCVKPQDQDGPVFNSCVSSLETLKRQSEGLEASGIGRRQSFAPQGLKKRRRKPKACKNKEEAETQRMIHIAVERNRRKQMNEHLAVLRSLMPKSNVQRVCLPSLFLLLQGNFFLITIVSHIFKMQMHKDFHLLQGLLRVIGIYITNFFIIVLILMFEVQCENVIFLQCDQASVVGGAIKFVKELEHQLQSLEAQKYQLIQQGMATVQANEDASIAKFKPPFAQSLVCPHYTLSQTPNRYTSKTKASIADIEVTLIETHANLRIMSQRSPRQLSKLVAGFQTLCLTILHLNVTTMEPFVLYSISAKVEEGCQLISVDDIATAVHNMLRIIEEEGAFCC